MRTALYKGADGSLFTARLAVSSTIKDAQFLFPETERCKASYILSLGPVDTYHEVYALWAPKPKPWAPHIQRTLPRGFWKHLPESGVVIPANLAKTQLVTHTHQCAHAQGHQSPHMCKCEYEWEIPGVAGGAVGWSALDAATQLTSIAATEKFFDDEPNADPNVTVDVEIDSDFVSTPTDDMLISVYGTLDGGTDYDDTPRLQLRADNGTDPNQVGFQTFGIFQYRVGVVASGATDTHTSADMNNRLGTMS